MKISYMNRVVATIVAIALVLPASAEELCNTIGPRALTTQASTPANEATGACEVLKWDRERFGKPLLSITRPGKYCLDQDYEFVCSPLDHGCMGHLIDIRASNVELDFRGHALRVSGTKSFSGVRGYGRNVRIHHGRIEGTGIGVLLSDKGNSPIGAYPELPISKDDVFTHTRFIVENMQFSDVETAILFGGSGNQIRDNRIDATLDSTVEDGPSFALLSYGPGARIERNIIRLSALTPGRNGYAMYLRSADGTLVANNTVQVDGARTGTISVVLSSSTNVDLQSNQFETEKITELDARSSLR